MTALKSFKKPKNEKAVLIFADSLALDLARRKWPGSYRSLLELTFLEGGQYQFEADLHLFTSPFSTVPERALPDVTVHPQQGRSFSHNLAAAVEKLAQLGYREIVIVGRDCPDLDGSDIETAFRELEQHRLVVGPDHRGGVYLIAFHIEDRTLLHRIQWQQNTDCGQLIQRFGESHCFLLPVKQDLDNLSDLKLLSLSNSKFSIVARSLLCRLIFALQTPARLNENSKVSFEKLMCQLPPPLVV